jgi:hypothetical protein
MTSNERGVNEVNKSLDILQYTYYFLPPHLTNRNTCFGLKHLDARVADEAIKTKLEEPERQADQSTFAILLVCASVANGVQNSRDNPASTKDSRCHGELQASNEQRSDKAGLVLEVVAVIAKSACVHS